ncbi:MAG: ribonuclease HII [Clostridia bacterium]|nr:ribonuclease HII [Clostridia bacterium]MBR5277658.1 ribonuclease HII [Clostridia bacterium]
MDWSYEISFIANGESVVCGCDEAGRGPLCGPVVAAAVILPQGLVIEGLDDSKKLSEKKREQLYKIIRENAIDCAIGHAEVYEIEKYNILNCAMLAMNRAVEKLKIKPQLVLADGNIVRGFKVRAVPVIKGDALCPSIAAASVLAKVARDRLLDATDKLYPNYGFAKHKGYGTKAHREALLNYGVTQVHRNSFLKKILEK